MVLASTVLNFFAGGTFVYGFTVFFNPIRNTFGWGAAVTSVAFTLQRLESGLLEAAAGYLVDRLGPRRLMVAGWSVVGLGFVLMSRIQSLWQFYGAFLLIAVGLSFGAFTVIFSTIANWFHKKRSRAMTLVVTGFGISGLLVPLVAMAVEGFGWRQALLGIGVAAWALGIPLSLLMRHRPQPYGLLPDGATTASITNDTPNQTGATSFTPLAALRTRAFWMLAAVFFFQFTGISAVNVHIVPYLESVGIATTLAATAVTGITLCSLIGRLGFGLLGDFANKRTLIAIGMALQALGVFIFSFVDTERVWLLIPFLLTYAPGFGATIPLRLAIQADYFGTANYGTIMGMMMLISMVGGLASPIIAGWLYDTIGSYQMAWQIFALITLPAAPLMLLARPPRPPRRAGRQP